MITADLLRDATQSTTELAKQYASHLDAACKYYDIYSAKRIAAFLGQLTVESGNLRYSREIASGKAYEGRKDLGNTEPGDGERFRGRGLIQLTGRDNYRVSTQNLAHINCPNFELYPEAVEQPMWAAWVSAEWWYRHGCNALADNDEYIKIGRLINRGNANSSKPANHEELRIKAWEIAKRAVNKHLKSIDNYTVSDSPEWPKQESNVEPFTTAALGAIINAAPALIDLFKGDSKSAERNSEAAKVVVNVAKDALQAKNEQEVVERLQSDPQAVDTVKQAIQENWFKIHKATEQSIAESRKFAIEYSNELNVRTVVGRFTYIEFLGLVFLLTAWAAIGALAAFNKISEGTLDNIIMLAAVASIVGIREFWYGSSFGSHLKDDRSQK